MSNILKVTAPVTGYENVNNIKQGNQSAPDSRIQGVVDPSRIARTDARSDAGQSQDAKLGFNYESNFHAFLSMLKNTPSAMESMVRFFESGYAARVESGIGKDMAAEISRFLSMVELPESGMLDFIKGQAEGSNRFQGPFFDLLRQVFTETDSFEVKANILDLAKRYGDMAAGKHLMENIRDSLGNISDHMLKKPASQLRELAERLDYGDNSLKGEGAVKGEVGQNAKLLKEEILPFLNRYITGSHDRGPMREQTAQLASLIARYENGDKKAFLQLFDKLQNYSSFHKRFDGITPERMELLLEKGMLRQEESRNAVTEHLLRAVSMGLKGETGAEGKIAAMNLMNSVLLNESVFMPVLHMMFPMNVDGNLVYSEMWVDPDDESGAQGGEEDRTVKALIKFDIQGVGFFDLFFLYRGGEIDIQLDYPEELGDRDREIRQNLDRILSENGIRSHTVVLGKSTESIPLSEAFPQIYERRNMINVRI